MQAQALSPINENYAEIRRQVSQTPSFAERSITTLAKYLTKNTKNDTERAYAIFYWLSQNVAYDTQGFFSGSYGDLSPAGVLRSRKAVCSGYSRLFTGLAKAAGLEVVEITGVSKGYGFSTNGTLGDHAWNAVKIKGQWRLIDSTWGAGFLNEGNKFQRKLENFYFFTPPEQFIHDHFPNNSKWQLLKSPISKTKFKQLVYLTGNFFKYGIELYSHHQSLIKVKNQLTVSLLAPKNVVFLTTLSTKNGQKLDKTLTFSQRNGKRQVIQAVFPHKGLFTLKVFAKNNYKTGAYDQVLEYTVQAKPSSIGKIGFPKTYGDFNTRETYLYNPKIYTLKSGQRYYFKIKIPGAFKVAVIDNRGWHFLDKRGQIFSGYVSASKGRITLSAKLHRNKNSYATLVEYKGE